MSDRQTETDWAAQMHAWTVAHLRAHIHDLVTIIARYEVAAAAPRWLGEPAEPAADARYQG